ncbi:MAG: Ppx/GppA phosphatase family protein [Rubricoccaceae bacterium]|nr:Ppx/GppA phosphatase family protein [Rubricoccaceae bacterium]
MSDVSLPSPPAVPSPVGADGDLGEIPPTFVVSRPTDVAPVVTPVEGDAVRLCVIDCGTNSFHAIIVDAFPDGAFEVLTRQKEMVKLGEGEFAEQRLTEAAMERGMEALRTIRSVGEEWGASAYIACATSAIREATNGGAYIDRVRRELGIVIRPITGETEARLIYLAVSHAVDLSEPSILADVGGGSTEFIVADAAGAHFLCSLPLGAQRLTEQFVTTDPVSRKEFRALRDHVRALLGDVFEAARAHRVRRLVGSSGTLNAIAGVTAAAYGDAQAPLHEQPFDAVQVREVTKRLMQSTLDERNATPGVTDRRADQIVAGAVLLDVLLKDLRLERFVVSPDALREGIVIDYVARELKWIRRLAPYRSRRRQSVYELAMRLRYDQAHAEHVKALALQLYDAAEPLHGRDADARELLEYAAVLHDIGYAISRRNHHKHALYIIQEADLQGFTPEEKAVVANVARYHRAGAPKATHGAFQRLDAEQKQLVLELAACLRLANGLDRSHYRNVARLVPKLEGEGGERVFALTLYTHADPALDVWAARQGAELFESVFGVPVEIRVAG